MAYAPASARLAWTGLLALDHRLARTALSAREPMLAQIRLAWWRDRFRSPAGEWPLGEPLLAVLAAWDREREALEALVDGWEQAVGGEPDPAGLAALVASRAGAMTSLARVVGVPDPHPALDGAAQAWASGSLPPGLGPSSLSAAEWSGQPLPRAMRPLAILARAPGESGAGRLGGVRALGRMIRVGLIGR